MCRCVFLAMLGFQSLFDSCLDVLDFLSKNNSQLSVLLGFRIIFPRPVKLNNRKNRWTLMIQTHEKCRWTREQIALREELKQFGMASSEIAKPVWYERCLRMKYVLQHLPPPARLWRWNRFPPPNMEKSWHFESIFQSNVLKFNWA